jgi:hypothetical protein
MNDVVVHHGLYLRYREHAFGYAQGLDERRESRAKTPHVDYMLHDVVQNTHVVNYALELLVRQVGGSQVVSSGPPALQVAVHVVDVHAPSVVEWFHGSTY